MTKNRAKNIKINFSKGEKKKKPRKQVFTNVRVEQHPDSFPRMQNTHWYAVSGGWTSVPEMATLEEVERVGLHDCDWQGCEEAHAGSAEGFVQRHIIAEETSLYHQGKATPCYRSQHPCDGGWYCVGHGESWPCSFSTQEDPDPKKAPRRRRATGREILEGRKKTRR